MLNLAELKRTLAIPGTRVILREFKVHKLSKSHPFLNIPRTVKKLQTNSVCLVTEGGETSWMEFGKAADWSFTDNMAKENSGSVIMVYEILKGGENNNSVSG